MRRILADRSFHVILSRIEHDLADQTRAAGCPHCDGKLHSARYPRKPRCRTDLGPEWRWRLSFCCAQDGCRKRVTPPSVRFLGRRVFPAVVVVLVTALTHEATARRQSILRRAIGVDRRTLARWRQWWIEAFPKTSFWKEASARFQLPVQIAKLPNSLVACFGKLSAEVLASVLRFLSPLSRRGCDRSSHAT